MAEDSGHSHPERIRLHGRLSGDSVEGGGLFLVCANGTRVELALPRGWQRPTAAHGLLDGGHREVAALGDEVDVLGDFTTAIASIRQQGRLFSFTDVSK